MKLFQAFKSRTDGWMFVTEVVIIIALLALIALYPSCALKAGPVASPEVKDNQVVGVGSATRIEPKTAVTPTVKSEGPIKNSGNTDARTVTIMGIRGEWLLIGLVLYLMVDRTLDWNEHNKTRRMICNGHKENPE